MRIRPAPSESRRIWWEPPGDWAEKAQCAQSESPDMWFPDGEAGTVSTALAKGICRECPVRLACLGYALRHETGSYRYGIYGGLTPGQRYELSKRRAR